MPLEWSEPRPPTRDVCHYDHVVAETPLGQIIIEWKSWKCPGEGYTAHMPWDHFVVGDNLDDAKRKVQEAWNRMAAKVAAVST